MGVMRLLNQGKRSVVAVQSIRVRTMMMIWIAVRSAQNLEMILVIMTGGKRGDHLILAHHPEMERGTATGVAVNTEKETETETGIGRRGMGRRETGRKTETESGIVIGIGESGIAKVRGRERGRGKESVPAEAGADQKSI
ncbi:hypothetical protein CK203_020387 [Vitis vinifera]|uniref:Uncharacterized protein n=1 Tax=Vitis vinifera TaxID=29760 RepID=A0A438IIX4_VITVI|nr:hypothetical protein CK203_020387 [Vitis vinifera]